MAASGLSDTEGVEPGEQWYESRLFKTVFLTFLKLKTAKNKSSALLSGRH